MVRAPCCEKMGLKKGPWTPEEDQVLVDYIQRYGHGNWRALPKQAGLSRCGKSCRLRWTNYLRPDIKRGNFSREEEETIIELHEMLGNRWSAIAAKLPGRTDNEIKNVWHTHLKKRAALRKTPDILPEFSNPQSIDVSEFEIDQQPKSETYPTHHALRSESGTISTWHGPISPQQSCSDISSSLISTLSDDNPYTNNMFIAIDKIDSPGNFPEIDESFWLDVLSSTSSSSSAGDYSIPGDFPAFETGLQYEFPLSPLLAMEPVDAACSSSSSSLDMHDDMDFWYNLFKRAGEYPSDLPGI